MENKRLDIYKVIEGETWRKRSLEMPRDRQEDNIEMLLQ